MQLKDPTLLRQQAYINGAWLDADNGETHPVTNPATGEHLGTIPMMGAAETRRAIEAANAAWPAWRKKTAKERAAVLRKWYDLIMANADDLALLMTTEQGKPLAESKGEVAFGASFIEWFAEEGKRVHGDTLASPDRPIKLENITLHEPVIKVAIEPKTKIDQEKMSVALGRLAEEDPTFMVQTNEETGQTEISGMGELHLEVLVDRMLREFKVDANVGRPQVSYR